MYIRFQKKDRFTIDSYGIDIVYFWTRLYLLELVMNPPQNSNQKIV